MNEQKNLILAVTVAVLILVGFNYFYERPKQEALMRRERAVNHGMWAPDCPKFSIKYRSVPLGAHPSQAVLGGPFGPAAGGPLATYN